MGIIFRLKDKIKNAIQSYSIKNSFHEHYDERIRIH